MTEPKRAIRLAFAGDLSLGGRFLEKKQRRGLAWAHPFEELPPSWSRADLRFANLECTLHEPATADEEVKQWLLWAPPAAARGLRDCGLDVVSIANNHITDAGGQGIVGTARALGQKGIAHAGAGRNRAEAGRPAVLRAAGRSVAFLAFCDRDIPGCVMAGEQAHGACPLVPDEVEAAVRTARRTADVLCVSLHWGLEYHRYPAPGQRLLAQRIVDWGADVVVGHHPHLLQGFESHAGGVILYSLGNFFLPGFRPVRGPRHRYPPECRLAAIASVTIGAGGVESTCFDLVRNRADLRVRGLRGRRLARARRRLRALSAPLSGASYAEFSERAGREDRRVIARRAARRELRFLVHKLVEGGLSSVVRKLRPHNFRTFWRSLRRALQGPRRENE